MSGQKLRVLKALRQAGTAGLRIDELNEIAVCRRSEARVDELRNKYGYGIKTTYETLPSGAKIGRYTLHSEPSPVAASPIPTPPQPAAPAGALFELDDYRPSPTPHHRYGSAA